MKRWEYTILRYGNADPEKELNKLGKQGWRIIKLSESIDSLDSVETTILLERELPEVKNDNK